LIQPLITSKQTISNRFGFLIKLISDNGSVGYGEVSPLPGFSASNLQSTFACLNKSLENILNIAIPETLKQISELVADIAGKDYGCCFALETALSDLISKADKKPLSRWLSINSSSHVPVNYLLPRPVNNWNKEKTTILQNGYQAIKIKVGENVAEDVEFIRQVRETFGDKIGIRLDANQAWNYEDAEKALKTFSSYRIEYIEEPLDDFNPKLLKELKDKTGVSIALDESLSIGKNVESIIKNNVCDVLIIKPSIIGGIYKTLCLAEKAKNISRRVVITSVFETEAGLSALLHIAASISEIEPSGLDTLRLFTNYDKTLSFVSEGMIKVPDLLPGTGVDDKLWGEL